MGSCSSSLVEIGVAGMAASVMMADSSEPAWAPAGLLNAMGNLGRK